MDKVPVYGTGDSGFESRAGLFKKSPTNCSVVPSATLRWPNGYGAGLRNQRFRVRVPGGAVVERGTSNPVGVGFKPPIGCIHGENHTVGHPSTWGKPTCNEKFQSSLRSPNSVQPGVNTPAAPETVNFLPRAFKMPMFHR